MRSVYRVLRIEVGPSVHPVLSGSEGAGSAAVNALYTVPSGFDVSGNGFAGAFGTGENWMDGWTNFDPQNTVY